MTAKQSATLNRKQIRDIFRGNKGEAAKLSEKLGVSHATVSLVLSGKGKSKRVLEAANLRAVELLELTNAA